MPINGLKWSESPASSPQVGSDPTRHVSAGSGVFGDEVERARRVELFRRAVKAGTYRVDSHAVADRLLECAALESDDER